MCMYIAVSGRSIESPAAELPRLYELGLAETLPEPMKLSGIGTPLLSPFTLVLLLLLTVPPRLSRADVGTAAHYSPPYTPTACFGNDPAQFPSSNFFAAAGEGIWDNGASCGRQYLVRCISASVSGTCVPGRTIQVRIVDRALSSSSRPSSDGATIVLSTTAFGAITKLSAAAVNVEYQQV